MGRRWMGRRTRRDGVTVTSLYIPPHVALNGPTFRRELVIDISFAILKEVVSITQTHIMRDKGVSYL